MGHRELLLTLGAMVIFGLTSITVNQNIINSSEALYDQQVEYLAMNVAQKYIEEAKTKAYDHNTINKERTVTINSFAHPTGMGHAGHESYPHGFDDIDDFNGLDIEDNSTGIPMQVEVVFQYVEAGDLNTPVATRQYYKKMTVNVTNDYLPNEVVASYIFSYQKNK